MKRSSILLSVLFLFAVVLQLFAGIPPGYYDSAEGTRKVQLKTALHQIIKNARVLKYGNGEGYTWQGFYQTDKLSDGYVLDRYSAIKRSFNGSKSVSGMHIEHSFANSWWGGIKNQAYKDLHHLYPADGTANMRKSNHPIGVVDEEVGTPNGVIKVGWSSSRPGGKIKAWEPADEYKGDFARTYMYMVTCYEDYADLWRSEGLNMLDNNTYPVFEKWAISLLLKWNEEDPVNEVERARNEKVYSIQGNRNPFIDHSELAEYIWGKDTIHTYYTQSTASTPELFVPSAGSVIDFGLRALSVPASEDVMVRGRNLNGDLTLSLSNDNFILSKQQFSPEEVFEGAVLNITANPLNAGERDAVLILSYDGTRQQVNIKANLWDGIPAYPAKDIVCIPYQKSFVANWMKMPSVTAYELDVYKQEGKSLSGYPTIVGDTTEYKITELADQTTYFYTVKASGLNISNEVSVVMPKITPDFTVKDEALLFTSVPKRVSGSVKVEPTMEGTETTQLDISTSWPFAVSSSGHEWNSELTLNNSSPSFYIRMEAIDEEGDYEEEAILKTQGAEDIIISLLGNVDAGKAFFEDFENNSKTKYAKADLELPSGKWRLEEAVIGTSDNDKKNGSKSVKLRHNSGSYGKLEMLEDKANGVGNLSFFAGAYGSEAVGDLAVEYSVDGGISWTNVPKGAFTVTKEWKQYDFPLNINGSVRIRIKKTDVSSTSTRHINIDDICMTDYDGGTKIKALSTDACKLSVEKNNLCIHSDKAVVYSVYSLQGILVRQGELNIGETYCALPSGAYIVRIGEVVYKILL